MLRSSSTEHSKNSKRKCVRMHVPINDSLISNRSVRNSWKQRRSSGADFERKISIISPLRLAIHLVQNHHAGEQKSHWDKTNKGNYHLIMYVFSLSVPVQLLLSSMPFLY